MTSEWDEEDRHLSSFSDLQSWSEVPCIAHFCSLFRRAFDLIEFDIQELEESLLLMEPLSDESSFQLVPRLVVKLLRGCSRTLTRAVNYENYNVYLRRLFQSKAEEAEEDKLNYNTQCASLLENEVNFEDLSLRSKVRILQHLCEFRLDAEDVSEKVKNLEASSLRVNPLGRDSESNVYWYFYGTRLYREAVDDKSKKRREKKKKKKEKREKRKKKKKNRDSSTEDDDETSSASSNPSRWSVVCLTMDDWEELTGKLQQSKNKHDRALYGTLSDYFLPEIQKMFAQKEREERRRIRLAAPKRSSTRIEKKRMEQEESDRQLAEKMIREDDPKNRKPVNRTERLLMREQIREREARKRAENDSEKHSSNDEREKDQSKAGRMKRKRSEDVKADNGDSQELSDSSSSSSASSASSDSNYAPPAAPRSPPPRPSTAASPPKRTNFTNALLKAGTKSMKDANLDKVVRKSPGLLLQAAGLQKQAGLSSLESMSSGQKISFDLYGGHLPVDHGSFDKSNGGEVENDEESKASLALPKQKIFSNWGGEFFKKNLDYRANTNKILEKMNLASSSSGLKRESPFLPFKKSVEEKKETFV